MKLSLTRTSLSSVLAPLLCNSHPSRRPISSLSVSHRPTSLSPETTPLFLRPPTSSASLSDLLKFRNWAETLSSSTGASFSALDNGPDTHLLLRELTWLLEDALENPKTLAYCIPSAVSNDLLVSLRADLEELYTLWKQRIDERRPFQYIVGCEHWRDLVLGVREGVLIPRPETEHVVDLVSDAIKGNDELGDGLWADLGTGSGALAIGIARILRDRGMVIATDLSPVAVEVASFNVQRYNLQDKVAIRQGSWFGPLKEAEGDLVGLVSNPPYIPTEHIDGLQAEVKHEPRLALDGGTDGIGDLLYLCNGAVSMLKPGGFFAFETNGEKQCKFLVDYMETKLKGSFNDVNIVSDFAGIQRFVTGFRSR
ncbi:hypothetical protein RJ639_000827 [Escallonia herrerae]|uniref:Peptide chain release factor N(5)-glutamine methyltransferase n=1 Tax=Escallonia herrerae TaxID=1293975 RepID=A0AA88XQD3_9ASTE|nr:hypothetical protein RJ639_043010 [Escallonia herrerae]KAK3042575.1 hypothetical protein RJ639_000827 [Escallonia herrerae]